jgi:hypothetical protein
METEQKTKPGEKELAEAMEFMYTAMGYVRAVGDHEWLTDSDSYPARALACMELAVMRLSSLRRFLARK